MPTLTITKTYSDGNVLTESMIDAIKNGIETFLNTTKIDGDNIQTGGVPTAAIADLAVTTAKLNSEAVTTAKIADSNVTTAKIADSNVTTAKIADSNVTTAKIADLNVTTGKIADNAVTQAKRASLGQQVSSSSASFGTTSLSFTDVTNLSVSITTTGRPVWIGLISDGTSSSILEATNGNLADRGELRLAILRDASIIYRSAVATQDTYQTRVPAGAVWHVDVPAAGTYTYKVQAHVTDAAFTGNVYNAKLVAFEL